MPQFDPEKAASLERAVLTQCFRQSGKFIEASRLEGADFNDARNRTLFEIGCDLDRAGTLHFETLLFELDQRGLLEVAGGVPYVVSVVDGALLRSTDLVDRLVEGSNRRHAAARLGSLAAKFHDEAASIDGIGDEVRQALVRASDGRPDEFAPLGSLGDELLARFRSPVIDPGLPTMIGPLDEQIGGGLKPSQLMVIAGATSSGKSSLASEIVLGTAFIASKRPERFGGTLVFSFEMSRDEIYLRMIAQSRNVSDSYRPPRGWLAADQALAEEGVGLIADLPIVVFDQCPPTVEAVRARVERYTLKHGKPALVVVDHIGLMGAGRTSNRVEAVGEITRGLKAIAKELEIPVLALAQINREAAKRDNHRPNISDLRESGSIEQDADIALLVYRASYYKDPEERRAIEKDGAEAELILAKNRNGETGVIRTVFLGRRFLFIPDPTWQPRYAPAGTAVLPEIIQAPIVAMAETDADRVVKVLRAKARGDGWCPGPDLREGLGLKRDAKLEDSRYGKVVDQLVDAGRVHKEMEGRVTLYRVDAPPAANPSSSGPVTPMRPDDPLGDLLDAIRLPANDIIDSATAELFN